MVKALKSPFALVLSGTPLENRLDDLFSIVEFIDDRRLGPAFRFYNKYLELHNGHRRIVSSIISKKYISEMDLLRLQKALLMCRMAANSTFLVDKNPPGYSSKLEELDVLIDHLMSEQDRKIVLFSEWTTMLNLIEPLLNKRELDYVRLDGSVPQKKRQGLVHQFQNDPNCKLFITTNAGSMGLNLQAAISSGPIYFLRIDN